MKNPQIYCQNIYFNLGYENRNKACNNVYRCVYIQLMMDMEKRTQYVILSEEMK